MNEFLKRILGDKKEWRAMEARAKALPSDYGILYDEIKNYMFRFSGGNGMDIVEILKDLLGLFESAAADGRSALEVTGDDVAAFCDELLKNAKTYTENWRADFNRDVHKKLSREDKKS